MRLDARLERLERAQGLVDPWDMTLEELNALIERDRALDPVFWEWVDTLSEAEIDELAASTESVVRARFTSWKEKA